MRARGEGVQNPENFADVIYGFPLTAIFVRECYVKVLAYVMYLYMYDRNLHLVVVTVRTVPHK